jgi:competence protein ComEC
MGRGVVGPYLWNRGIKSIDHVIATHPQLDHVGGLTWVLKHLSVGHYWGIGVTRDELFYHRLQQALAQRGLSEEIIQAGQGLTFSDDCRLSIENPPDYSHQAKPSPAVHKEGQWLNNRSVVTRLSCGGHAMLFPADVEQEALARMQAQHQEPVDVLKVPHHGAASSLNRGWIASLHPQYAVISVGRHNPYGHPARVVLEAYETQGIPVFRTDRDGGVWIEADRVGGSLHIHTTRGNGIKPTVLSHVWNCETDNWHRLWRQWRERV